MLNGIAAKLLASLAAGAASALVEAEPIEAEVVVAK